MARFDYAVKMMEREIENGQIAGGTVMVLKDGAVILNESRGFANKERKTLMKDDTIIHLFSMSKPVTSAAAMILAERGLIDFLDPVSKFLPGFKNQMVETKDGLVPANREVTIRDLLNMTSGICYPNGDSPAGIAMDRVFRKPQESAYRCPTLDMCNMMGEVPLVFQPGERWMYGASADVLGGVVEVVSGKKYSEFLKTEIFDRLGMHDTSFSVPDQKKNRMARIYEYDEGLKALKPLTWENLGINNCGDDNAFESGGAGLMSTITDYAKFASMLLNGGTYKEVRILGRKTVDFMRTNQLTDAQRAFCDWDSLRGCGYGNLMRVILDKGATAMNASVGEFGWDGWTGNYMSIDPSENMVILYFIQRAGAGMNEATRRMRNALFGAL